MTMRAENVIVTILRKVDSNMYSEDSIITLPFKIYP